MLNVFMPGVNMLNVVAPFKEMYFQEILTGGGGNTQYRWPPYTNKFRWASFENTHIIFI